MTREELRAVFQGYIDNPLIHDKEPFKEVVRLLGQQPCEDCISRADAISAISKALSRTFVEHEDIANKIINKLPSVTPQEPKTDYKSFAEWVAGEIFSDNWEYDQDAFEEIACRKLSTLGIVTKTNDEWVYEEKTEQEPKTGWIPVSERLPDKTGTYFVTKNFGTWDIVETANYTNNLYEINKYDFSNKKRAGWYDFDGEYGYYEVDDVTAWQPLPKPYSEVSE